MEKQRESASFNEVQRYIQACTFPCSKEELIHCAREHEAPFEVIRTLETIKSEQRFNSPENVRQFVEKPQM